MPRSGRTTPPDLQAADLQRRAQRIRHMAREFPKDTSDKLLALAAELDLRAEAIELPINPDAPDP
jgi:hypothetical protein